MCESDLLLPHLAILERNKSANPPPTKYACAFKMSKCKTTKLWQNRVYNTQTININSRQGTMFLEPVVGHCSEPDNPSC